MHLFVGALLVLGGLGCLRYVWAGETAFESEPPFLALCVLLVATGVGLAMRARAALLLTQVALGGTLLVLATKALRLYVGGPRDPADDSLVALVYLFGFAWPRPAWWCSSCSCGACAPKPTSGRST